MTPPKSPAALIFTTREAREKATAETAFGIIKSEREAREKNRARLRELRLANEATDVTQKPAKRKPSSGRK